MIVLVDLSTEGILEERSTRLKWLSSIGTDNGLSEGHSLFRRRW